MVITAVTSSRQSKIRFRMALSVSGEELGCEKKPGKGGGGNNNTGPGGIQIRRLDPNSDQEPPLIGTINTGSCSFEGRVFTANGSGGGFKFSMRIAGAKPPKPEAIYSIPRGSGASYINVTGAGGPYSSKSGPAGYANGAIILGNPGVRSVAIAAARKAPVTAMAWNGAGDRLIVGDEAGDVVLVDFRE